jgi:hypothetical protein
VAGSFGHGSEPPGPIKVGEFLDYLRDSQLLKKVYAPGSELGSFLMHPSD